MDLIFVIALLIALGLIVFLKRLLGKASNSESLVRYRTKGPLLTPAERSFYGVLKQAVGDSHEIHSKVRIADVLAPAKGLGKSEWQKSFNKISAKHFDFTLCNPETLAIEKVIELNDSSHKKSHRASRDQFIQTACESANLQLLFFAAKRTYSVAELREELAGKSSPA